VYDTLAVHVSWLGQSNQSGKMLLVSRAVVRHKHASIHHARLQPVVQGQQLQALQPPPPHFCSLGSRHAVQARDSCCVRKTCHTRATGTGFDSALAWASSTASKCVAVRRLGCICWLASGQTAWHYKHKAGDVMQCACMNTRSSLGAFSIPTMRNTKHTTTEADAALTTQLFCVE